MNVKSAFLNGYLTKEVYVPQPRRFIDAVFPQHLYKLDKSLYGLKQAPKAWYERLTIFLGQQGYVRGRTDKTLFIHRKDKDIIVAQTYVDDIIFSGFPNDNMSSLVHIMQS